MARRRKHLKIEGVSEVGTLVSLDVLKPTEEMDGLTRCTVIIPSKNVMEWYNTLAGYQYMYNHLTNCVDVILDTRITVEHLKVSEQTRMSFKVNDKGVVEGIYDEDTFFRLVHIMNTSLFDAEGRQNPDLLVKGVDVKANIVSVLNSKYMDKFRVGQMYSLYQARNRVLASVQRGG